MPIAEYKCDCGWEYELITTGVAKAHMKCPKCGKRAIKQFSASSFVLKGSGWPGKDIKGGS